MTTIVPHCFILIGPPASGKSTYRARHLVDSVRPVTVISSDDMIDDFAAQNGITYSEAFPKVDMKAIVKDLRALLLDAVSNDHDIIVDRTNMTVGSRNKTLANIPKRYRRVGVVFDVPREVLDERLAARAQATGKHIPAHVVDGMISSYEEPIVGEFDEIIRIGRD